jgi:hypothetical protein
MFEGLHEGTLLAKAQPIANQYLALFSHISASGQSARYVPC